jgi:hypothetical protein
MNVDQAIAVIRAALHADTLTCGQTMAIRGLWSGARDDVLTFEDSYDPAHAHDMAKLRREQLEAEDFRDEEDFYTDDNEYMEIVDEEEAPRVSAEEWKSRIIASGRITRKEPR